MKRSASCFSAFPFDSHFEICIQNGSIFCNCKSTSNLSAVSDFGVVLGVSVTSGAMASVCGVVSSDELCWAVLLLVLNAGPSRLVADSMLIVAGLSWGYSTRCKRKSAALLWGPDINLKVILYVASSNPHMLTLLFAFFSIKKSCPWFVVIAHYYFSCLKVIIPFHDCVIYTVGFLFFGAPFPLSVREVCERNAIGNSVPSCSWDSCAPQASSDAYV